MPTSIHISALQTGVDAKTSQPTYTNPATVTGPIQIHPDSTTQLFLVQVELEIPTTTLQPWVMLLHRDQPALAQQFPASGMGGVTVAQCSAAFLANHQAHAAFLVPQIRDGGSVIAIGREVLVYQ